MGLFETPAETQSRQEQHVNSLDVSRARVCELTGFLEFKGDTFTPKNKSTFLSRMERTGDEVDAMDAGAGYDQLLLDAHLKLDTAFALAYKNTRHRMVKKMEGVMYRAALDVENKTDRAKWLAANCPEKYGAGAGAKDSDDSPRDLTPQKVAESKWSRMAAKALDVKGEEIGEPRGARKAGD